MTPAEWEAWLSWLNPLNTDTPYADFECSTCGKLDCEGHDE